MRLALSTIGSIAAFALLASACGPPDGGSRPRGGDGSGDEDIMFPDEAAASAHDAPAATPTVSRAEALLARGNADEARTILEGALLDGPEDPRARLDLGLALEMLGDARGAERAYRSALAALPDFPEALNNLGLLLREQERLDEAVEVLREAARVRPDFASAHVNLGLALEESGDLQAAAEAYQRAIRFAPRDPMSRINLGLVLVRLGQHDQGAIELRRAIPLSRDNPAALQAIGNGLRLAGQAEAAAGVMQSAVEAREGGATPALLSELALAQLAAGNRPAAEATLRQAIALDADYATAWYLLGNVLAGGEAFDEAARCFRRYLELAPDGQHAAAARERLRIVQRARTGR